jgi:hypothetical protein
MQKRIAAFAGGLLVVLSVGSTMAKTETLTGQVIDLVCYMQNKSNTGMDHTNGRECAAACAKWEGQPVGLLTADGKLYQFAGDLVANNNAKIVPHLTHKVTVTGDVSERAGMMIIAGSDVTMVSK